MTPTSRAVGLLVAAALSSAVLPVWVVLVVMVVVGAISVGDALTVRHVPAIVVEAPEILSRGVPSILKVSVDRIDTRVRQNVASADLTIAQPEGWNGIDTTIVSTRRGRHRLGPISTRAIGGLGMGAWYHRVDSGHEFVVYPDMPAARRLAMEVRTGVFRDEAKRSRGPLGLGTDLESIREYVPDDDIRQVNWMATARVGTPMTNTYRLARDQDVICVLDTGRLMAAPVGDRSRMDAAVDAVAAVAAVTEVVGDRVGVIVFSDRVLRTVNPRSDGADAVLAAIHDLEADSVDADYEAAFRWVTGRKHAFVLVLTDLMDMSAGAPLVDALPILLRKHSVTIASVRDEAVSNPLRHPAESVTEALETAVAAALDADRAQLVTRISAMGGTVIDAPVDALSARSVAAYLRGKRMARV